MAQFPHAAFVPSHGVMAEHHAVAPGFDRERAQIKELVVQGAQRKTVRLLVGTADVVPLDMRCFEPGRDVADAEIESADAASPLMGAKNSLSKCRITLSTSRRDQLVGCVLVTNLRWSIKVETGCCRGGRQLS